MAALRIVSLMPGLELAVRLCISIVVTAAVIDLVRALAPLHLRYKVTVASSGVCS